MITASQRLYLPGRQIWREFITPTHRDTLPLKLTFSLTGKKAHNCHLSKQAPADMPYGLPKSLLLNVLSAGRLASFEGPRAPTPLQKLHTERDQL